MIQITPEAAALLTPEERQRLTTWKFCYILQAEGFTTAQARRLCWYRWLRYEGEWESTLDREETCGLTP